MRYRCAHYNIFLSICCQDCCLATFWQQADCSKMRIQGIWRIAARLGWALSDTQPRNWGEGPCPTVPCMRGNSRVLSFLKNRGRREICSWHGQKQLHILIVIRASAAICSWEQCSTLVSHWTRSE